MRGIFKTFPELPAPAIKVASILLDEGDIFLIDSVITDRSLTATIFPANAADKSISWDTSNAEVADVTPAVGNSAKITAAGPGSAIITVTTADGNFCASCKVNVYSPGSGGDGDPYSIYDAESLKKIADNLGPGVYYKLVTDIDLSSVPNWTPIGTSASGNQFSGDFNGDGHTISGLVINTSADYQGLFGYIGSGGSVENLCVSGNINSGSAQYIGIIAGHNAGTIQNCYTLGDITCSQNIGGITGVNTGTVKNCYTLGNITSTNDNAGGIVGDNGGTVQYCYALGDIKGNSSSTGGIVGKRSNGTIKNCVALNKNVSLPNGTQVGRVVGQLTGSGADSCLDNNYAYFDMYITANGSMVSVPHPGVITEKHGGDIDGSSPDGGYNNRDFWESTIDFIFSPAIWEWNGRSGLPILSCFPAGTQDHSFP